MCVSVCVCVCVCVCATLQLAKALQPYNLKWIEECLPPDDYTGEWTLEEGRGGER